MPTNADTPTQGPSLVDAANAIEGLLDLEEGTPGDQTGQAEDKAHVDTDGGVAADAEAQETPADEAGGAEEEATETDDDAETADAEQPQMVTVKVDGKTETVTLEEALKGYSRDQDYRRKTADLANERRKADEQAQAVREERQTYATMLVALRNQLQQGQEAEPDWNKVYEADPIGYARRRDEWRDKQDKLAAANFELQRLQSVQQQEQAEKLKQMVTQGRQKMVELLPAWSDQKTWDADRQAIVAYAQKVGYSAEEIAQAYDPRAVVTLHKARLYDELMAKKPVPVASKGPRVASAGAVQSNGAASRLNAAQQRLAKSGSVSDAAKVFEQLL